MGAQPQCLVGEVYVVLLPGEVPTEGRRPLDQPFADRFTLEANSLLDQWQSLQDADQAMPWSQIVGGAMQQC